MPGTGHGQITYEIETTKFNKDGKKTVQKIERLQSKPKEFKDLAVSMKMLEKIKLGKKMEEDEEKSLNASAAISIGGMSNLSKLSGAGGLISSIMNPKNVKSMQTMQLGRS